MKDNIITALDIGSSKICAIVGQVDGKGDINLIGKGLAKSDGIANGLVRDPLKLSNAVTQALGQAEESAGIEVYSVFTNISGSHIKAQNNQAVINLNSGEKKPVKSSDMRRAIEVVKAVTMPMDSEVLQVIPSEYMVDSQEGIIDPLRMAANRLGVRAHIITASTVQVRNIIRCVNEAGFEIEGVVPESLACSYTALNAQEKESGVVLINAGAGTTDMVIFFSGRPIYTAVIPRGGDDLTARISAGLNTSFENAEETKKRYGSAFSSRLSEDGPIMVPRISGGESGVVSASYLGQLIVPWVEQLLGQIAENINSSGQRNRLAAGVVITGGAVMLEGLLEKAEQILGLPVRVGLPADIQAEANVLSSPSYTTAVGLLQYGIEFKKAGPRWYDKWLLGRITGRVKDFIEEYF